MIVTYRYFKKKHDTRKAARENPNGISARHNADSESPPTIQSEEERLAKKAALKWKLTLMAVLVIPVFLETLDYTVVATAQSHIASVFNRLDLQNYIGTVYLLTSTVFLPLFASVADIFGRHAGLQVSLFFFLFGSAVSTGSMNIATMLAGRGIAGIGAAGLLAVVRIILLDSQSLDDNNWQQSILFGLYTVGYCLGPFLGGVLTAVSFRWVFAINLPFAAVAMVLAFLLLHGKGTRGAKVRAARDANGLDPAQKESIAIKLLRIDWIGSALFMIGGILILLALNWGSTQRWNSAKVIASFVVGAVTLTTCVLWEYYLERKAVGRAQLAGDTASPTQGLRGVVRTDPMIPLELFRSIDLCIVQYATFVSGMIMIVMFYFVAIFMTIVNGLSPTAAGVQLIYFAPGVGAGSINAIFAIKYLRQPKYPIVAGGIIATVALGLISMGMNMNKQGLVNGFMALSGVGVGLSIGPLAVQARFSQSEDRIAIVSALTLFFRSLGGTVGLAQCGAVLNAKVTSHLAALASSLPPSSSVSLSDAGSITSLTGIGGLPAEVQAAVRDAFREGTRWCFISLIPWSALALIATLFLRHIRDGDKKAREATAAVGAGPQDATDKIEMENLDLLMGGEVARLETAGLQAQEVGPLQEQRDESGSGSKGQYPRYSEA